MKFYIQYSQSNIQEIDIWQAREKIVNDTLPGLRYSPLWVYRPVNIPLKRGVLVIEQGGEL